MTSSSQIPLAPASRSVDRPFGELGRATLPTKIANEYVAGALFTMVVVAVSAGSVWIVLWGLQHLHPMLATLGMTYSIYAGLAVGDLAGEATAVWRRAARRGHRTRASPIIPYCRA